ncbi:WD40 repeat domain-containing protein [Terrabacter sp. Soil810]|uniref:WD40 repeat domain-containing protein n=1 Tax=Terrabacter sp. Soil810 TaxID=1736418 RepID=UPI00138EFD84|nr:WD40 repeat domain-containing protein [Terrabacter sp. Soil810]
MSSGDNRDTSVARNRSCSDTGLVPASSAPIPSAPSDVSERLGDFTGRDWLFRDVDAWLTTGARRFVLIGGPGSGKSTISARLVKDRIAGTRVGPASRLQAWHFCRARDDTTVLPEKVVDQLANQLANRVPGYLAALDDHDHQGSASAMVSGSVSVSGPVASGALVAGVYAEEIHLELHDTDPYRRFDRMIRHPLTRLAEARRLPPQIIILVDGVDEALVLDAGVGLVQLLSRVSGPDGGLPAQIRFLFTTRPDERVLQKLGPADLDLADPLVDDTLEYIRRRLSNKLTANDAEHLAGDIASAGAGNFLYARHVVDDLLSDPATLATRNRASIHLPQGLEEQYREYLGREIARSDDTWEERFRPLLGALSVAAGEGLTASQLAGITHLRLSQVNDSIKRLGPYLARSTDGPRRIFHQSFVEYLHADGVHYVYPDESEQSTANWLLESYGHDWHRCRDKYALSYTVLHLVNAVQLASTSEIRTRFCATLGGLLSDFAYLEAKIARAGVQALRQDLELAIPVLAEKSGDAGPESQGDWLYPRFLNSVLDRLSYSLNEFDLEKSPSYFAQQLRNGAWELDSEDLVRRADERLAQLHMPNLAVHWTARKQPRALKKALTPGLLRFRDNGVLSIKFDNANHPIAALWDGAVVVLDLLSGTTVARMSAIRTGDELLDWAAASEMAVTSDGRVFRASGPDIQVWDAMTGLELKDQPSSLPGDIIAVAVTPDGSLLAAVVRMSVSPGHWAVYVQRTHAGRWRQVARSGYQVTALGITPESIAVAFDGGRVKVWPTESRATAMAIPYDRSVRVAELAISGMELVAVRSDGILDMWDLRDAARIRSIPLMPVISPQPQPRRYSSPPDVLRWGRYTAISLEARRLVCWFHDGLLRSFDLDTGKEIGCVQGPRALVTIAITNSGDQAVTASPDAAEQLQLWDLSTVTREAPDTRGHEGLVNSVDLTDYGTVVSASDDGRIKAWDIRDGTELKLSSVDPSGWILSVKVAPNGRIVTGSQDGRVRVWDTKTGRVIRSMRGHKDKVTSIALLQEGARVVSASDDGTLKMWDLGSWQMLRTLQNDGGPVKCVAVRKDSRLVASGGLDRQVKIWDGESGNLVMALEGHEGVVTFVIWIGQYVVSASYDKTIRIWDPRTGDCLRVLHGHAGPVYGLAANSIGDCVLSASWDGTVRVWAVGDGHEMVRASLGTPLGCLTVAKDDETIIVGDATGNVWCLLLRHLARPT